MLADDDDDKPLEYKSRTAIRNAVSSSLVSLRGDTYRFGGSPKFDETQLLDGGHRRNTTRSTSKPVSANAGEGTSPRIDDDDDGIIKVETTKHA
jgi:hypothetical protein